jgi:chemotaxis response regulator CheB
MPNHDVVVVGGSAGALQPLSEVLSRLAQGLRACVVVVMHTPSNGSGVLPEILSRSTTLPVTFARTGDQLTWGRIYVRGPKCICSSRPVVCGWPTVLARTASGPRSTRCSAQPRVRWGRE